MADAALDLVDQFESALIAILLDRGFPVHMSRESFETIDIKLDHRTDTVVFSLKENNG